jgi:predicted O-methyltransferase YrrM
VVLSLTHLDSTQLEANVADYPNWFAKSAIDNFATYLIQDTGLPNLNYLQLGAFTGDASVWLLDEWANKSQYDFIYIDADHTTVGVLLDAELSWPLLKSGGIMAFDDLTWGADLPPSQSPKAGILLFAERHKDEFDLVVANTQYWIKKK